MVIGEMERALDDHRQNGKDLQILQMCTAAENQAEGGLVRLPLSYF